MTWDSGQEFNCWVICLAFMDVLVFVETAKIFTRVAVPFYGHLVSSDSQPAFADVTFTFNHSRGV